MHKLQLYNESSDDNQPLDNVTFAWRRDIKVEKLRQLVQQIDEDIYDLIKDVDDNLSIYQILVAQGFTDIHLSPCFN